MPASRKPWGTPLEKLIQSTCTVEDDGPIPKVPFFKRISTESTGLKKWRTCPSWCFKNISLCDICFKVFYGSEKVTAISKTSLRACGCRKHSHFHLMVHLNSYWTKSENMSWTNIRLLHLVEPIHTNKPKVSHPNATSLDKLQSLLQMSWQGNGQLQLRLDSRLTMLKRGNNWWSKVRLFFFFAICLFQKIDTRCKHM